MQKSVFVWIVTAVGLVALGPTLAAGQVCPGDPDCEVPFPDNVGPEIWVDGPANVQPGTERNHPDVAVDEMGRRIHVWDAFVSPSNPPRNEIFMRRFDPSGNPEADPFLVNTYTTNAQIYPRVAVATDGSFLVTWESFERNIADTANRLWVRSQLFDSDGDPVGSEQLLSTLSPERAVTINSDVAALREPDGSPGGFAVVWESNTSSGADTFANVQARVVSANGVPFGNQFQVNFNTPQNQTETAVTEIADGGFLVVWNDQNASQLKGRRYQAPGVSPPVLPNGGEFQISTTYDNAHKRPDAAIGWDGTIAIVWVDDELNMEEDEIRARVLDPDGTPRGASDFRVNDLTLGNQNFPGVADYGPKGFLVTWESGASMPGGDNDGNSVQARLMTVDGAFEEGLQVQYNIWTVEGQDQPASGGWFGRLATGWQSNGNPDTTDLVITGRDVEYCLFCDSFDWYDPGSPGSLWRWTSSVGAVARPENVSGQE